ncbi:alanine-glyoxylate aminotransferase 2 [Artemisia annua]|uniref:Alanine-glyoxylate aminotransferase 2 n=1 Tax=Artemisia annua TaxID=35608 RepID=A0A2U1P364_ARTAN|nr:alanine-glyoxylate aminotransferase 2 [Artemisia annua]
MIHDLRVIHGNECVSWLILISEDLAVIKFRVIHGNEYKPTDILDMLGDMGRAFWMDEYTNADKPVVIAISSCWVVYFVNSGTEANKLAMLTSRIYNDNLEMNALRNAYHGGSAVIIGLTTLKT